MSKVKNTMQLIEEARGNVDRRYDLCMDNLLCINEQSEGFFELIFNGFLFGYAQGMKAAKAEMKRAKKGGVANE